MDNTEILLFGSFCMVLVQGITESQPTYVGEDHIMGEATVGGVIAMDLEELWLAMSTVALYNYYISVGLFCFDNELRYWVKPRSITRFSTFLISICDDNH